MEAGILVLTCPINICQANPPPKLPVSEASDLKFNSREIEVLNLISQDLTNSKVGEKLFLSKRTVEGHRRSLILLSGMAEKFGLKENKGTLFKLNSQSRYLISSDIQLTEYGNC